MSLYTSFKDIPSYVPPNACIEATNKESSKIRSRWMRVTYDLITELRRIWEREDDRASDDRSDGNGGIGPS